jgi:cytidylate kinase
LVVFHRKNGHCNVPDDDAIYLQLAQWVATQGKDLKKYNKEKALLSASETIQCRVQKLNELKFDWETTYLSWEKRYVSEYSIDSSNILCFFLIISAKFLDSIG